jgi:hypothetical protein
MRPFHTEHGNRERAHRVPEASGVCLMLEAYDKVVGVPDFLALFSIQKQ